MNYKMHQRCSLLFPKSLIFHFKAFDTTSTFKVLIDPVDVRFTELYR